MQDFVINKRSYNANTKIPDSAGCIDMTGQINAFTSWLESTGKDLLVYVKYK